MTRLTVLITRLTTLLIGLAVIYSITSGQFANYASVWYSAAILCTIDLRRV